MPVLPIPSPTEELATSIRDKIGTQTLNLLGAENFFATRLHHDAATGKVMPGVTFQASIRPNTDEGQRAEFSRPMRVFIGQEPARRFRNTKGTYRVTVTYTHNGTRVDHFIVRRVTLDDLPQIMLALH